MGEPAATEVGLALHDLAAVHPDGTAALSGINLDVARGELIAVVGPSGSGKTTLLRAIAGLIDVRRGRVLIRGRDVTGVEPAGRDIAMVFEAGALVPFLDVAGNLGFGLSVRGLPRREVDRRVSDEARLLRLGRVVQRRPGELSAGERGRVGIGRAVIRVPALWLLDEPMAHLDAAQRIELRHWLVREVRRTGVTTLYVTHDPTEALSVGDRVAVLDRGRLLQVGTPADLYRRPGSVFVADFASSAGVGMLPARLISSAGLAGFSVGAQVLARWAALPPQLERRVGDEVVLVLRPEDVHDAAREDGPDLSRLDAVVVRAEFTGRDVAVTVELDAPAPAGGRARLLARFDRSSEVRAGERIALAVDATRAHVFDPITGVALWHPEER